MKIIAQVLAYEEGDYLQQAITPWLDVCERIDVFEGSFMTTRNLGYPARSTDRTIEIIAALEKNKNVVSWKTEAWNEPILRNDHLFSTIALFGREDTVLFILDGDEVYSNEDVAACVKQVTEEYEQQNTWWIDMINFMNDEHTAYTGFRVPRFFKLQKALGFCGYNNIAMQDGIKETDIKGALPNHYSWCPLEKAKRKIKWQTEALSWRASHMVSGDKVIFNDKYYQETGKQKPTLYNV